MPEIRPLVLLKVSPGGRLDAVNHSGELAPVTEKLNGWPTKPYAFNGLVMTEGALEPPTPELFVG